MEHSRYRIYIYVMGGLLRVGLTVTSGFGDHLHIQFIRSCQLMPFINIISKWTVFENCNLLIILYFGIGVKN